MTDANGLNTMTTTARGEKRKRRRTKKMETKRKKKKLGCFIDLRLIDSQLMFPVKIGLIFRKIVTLRVLIQKKND